MGYETSKYSGPRSAPGDSKSSVPKAQSNSKLKKAVGRKKAVKGQTSFNKSRAKAKRSDKTK